MASRGTFVSCLILGVFLVTSIANATDEVVGKVVVSISDDFTSRRSEVLLQVEERLSGRLIHLKFKDGKVPAALKSGDAVRIRGTKKNQSSEIEVDSVEPLLGEGASSPAEETVVAAAVGKKVVALLVNFTDGTAYLSATTVANHLKSINTMYTVATGDLIGFDTDANGDGQPDVFGGINIPVAGSGNCDYNVWATEADKAATAAGINLSLYQHRMYILPSVGSCGWAGLGNMPGTRTWVRAGGAQVFGHELGHNLGMHHASVDANNDGIVDSSGEYADGSCVMGNSSSLKGFNGPHAAQLGVYSAFSGKVLTGTLGLTTLGAVDLHPAATALPQVLRLRKTNSGDYYYVTYRAPFHYGVNLSASYSRRINIHRYFGSGSNKTHFIRSLGVGETFIDSANGLEVTAVSQAADGSTMTVDVKATCGVQPATLTLSPAATVLAPGGSAQVSVSVKNNDNEFCPATTFSLGAEGSAGFSGALSQSSLMLVSGEMKSVAMSVSSTLASGSGSITVTASDSDGLAPAHANIQAVAAVSIDSVAPTAPAGLAASVSRKGRVTLTWSASSDSGSGIKEYRIFRNGVQVGTSTTTSYSETSGSGSFTYHVVAIDRAGNISAASNSVSVTLSGGGGGGGGGKGGRK